jgi:hypothetical protein
MKTLTLTLASAALLLGGCSKKGTGLATISVVVPPAPSSVSAQIGTLFSSSVPNAVTDFSCLLVNVMGDGINTSSRYAGFSSVSSTVASQGQVALSAVSSLIAPASGGVLSLDVATGSSRIVSLLGVVSSVGCSGSNSADTLNNTSNFSLMIEMARTTTAITTDASITLSPPLSGYSSSTEARVGLASSANAFVSVSPATSAVASVPANMILTYSATMATPSTDGFLISNSTCTVAPSISGVSASGSTVVVALAAGTCTAGQAFTLTWPTGLVSSSGVAATGDSNNSVRLTISSANALLQDTAVTTHAFGAITGSGTVTVTFTNNGNVSATNVSPAFLGTLGAELSLTSSTCTGTITSGSSCTATVKWTPAGAGENLSNEKLQLEYLNGAGSVAAQSTLFTGSSN